MPVKTRRRVTGGNRFGMAVIAVSVIVLICVLLFQCRRLKNKASTYESANAQMEELIQEEEDRSRELDSLPEYVKSDEFIEKEAREKFGLVYPDEIVFRPE